MYAISLLLAINARQSIVQNKSSQMKMKKGNCFHVAIGASLAIGRI